jgi:CHAT domain-containing protein
MSAREIARMRLRAELITLSGCETGLSRVEAGDELFGLVRSFIAAGTRSLLVSLWRIDDETAVEFSSRLYGSWHSKTATPGSVSDAVRRAQLALLADHPHPAFWAPFILIGRR